MFILLCTFFYSDDILYKEQLQKYVTSIRGYIINAQNKVKATVNYAMVNAYWEIGEQIYRACGENERATYGKQLLQYISEKLTAEFGKGFDVTNLRNMRCLKGLQNQVGV